VEVTVIVPVIQIYWNFMFVDPIRFQVSLLVFVQTRVRYAVQREEVSIYLKPDLSRKAEKTRRRMTGFA
jgi:hypothetical protein